MAAAKNMHSDAVDTLLKRGAQVDIQRDVRIRESILSAVSIYFTHYRMDPPHCKLLATTQATLVS